MSLLILVRSLVSRIGNHVNHFICSAFVSFVVHQLSPSDTVMAESSDDDQEVSKELEVVIGTYEHFLIGYKVKVNGVSVWSGGIEHVASFRFLFRIFN